jgi:hypothetical protein
MITIFQDYHEAETQAKVLAAFHKTAYVVWRCGNRFTATPEASSILRLWPKADCPVRPVAVFDPDGTEYS